MKKEELEKIIALQTQAAIKEILGESFGEEKKQNRVSSLISDADSEEEKKKDDVKTEKPKKELVDISIDDVVEKLNMMRSGQSANKKEVKDNLDEYFKSLSMGERQSLYVFLDALNQILTAGVDGEKAPEPQGDKGIKFKATRTSDPTPAQKEKSDSIIVVGESQNKTEILRKLRELRG